MIISKYFVDYSRSIYYILLVILCPSIWSNGFMDTLYSNLRSITTHCMLPILTKPKHKQMAHWLMSFHPLHVFLILFHRMNEVIEKLNVFDNRWLRSGFAIIEMSLMFIYNGVSFSVKNQFAILLILSCGLC